MATNNFGDRLRRLRGERGYSQHELAALSGVSRALIARLETASTPVLQGRVESILRLSKALKIPVGDLLRGVKPSKR